MCGTATEYDITYCSIVYATSHYSVMPNIAASGSSKRKRAFCETTLDSDSEDERSVDIGLVVDNRGHTTSSRNVHVERVTKRPKAAPPPAVSITPVEPTASDAAGKSKKKQVSLEYFTNGSIEENITIIIGCFRHDAGI